MSNKFEKLLDYLVNEEMDKANELFHEIVVEKSRTIYENLIAEEAEKAKDDEHTDEGMHNDEEQADEGMYDEEMHGDMEEEESVHELAGDPSDDFVDSVVDKKAMDDEEGDDMDMEPDMVGDEEGDNDMPASSEEKLDAIHDTVLNMADDLAELQAEFDAMLGDKTEDDMDVDFDEVENEEENDEDEDEDEDDEEMNAEAMHDEEADESFVREYREVVGKNYPFAKNTEEAVNAKSTVNANPKDRPSTGATAKNIAQGGQGHGKSDGTKPEAVSKGLVGGVKGKFVGDSTLNVDGKQTKGYDKSVKKPVKGESGVNDKNVLPK